MTNLVCSKSDTVASNLGAAVDVFGSNVLRIVSYLTEGKTCYDSDILTYLLSLLYSHANTVSNYFSTMLDILRRDVLSLVSLD